MVYSEILPTPSLPSGRGVWTFFGETRIKAPAEDVFAALVDFHSYPKWNRFAPKIDTPSGTNSIAVGDMITLHYRPEESGETMACPCRIINFSEEEFSLCWRGCAYGIPAWIFLPEKVQEVIPAGEGECVFKVWETQAGPMAYVVKWSMGMKLSRMNQGIADGLKEFVERRGSGK